MESKIDQVVNKAIDKLAGESKGFVLDLAAESRDKLEDAMNVLCSARDELESVMANSAEGTDANKDLRFKLDATFEYIEEALDAVSKTSIEVRQTLPPHDEYQRPAPGRAHTIINTDSFVRFCKRYGTPEASLVMIDLSHARLVIDEHVGRGDRETACLPFTIADDWRDWSHIIGKGLHHRDLLRFLQAHDHNVKRPDLIKQMGRMRANTVVEVDSLVSDEGDNLSIIVKNANSGEDKATFVKTLPIWLPVLDQDATDEERWTSAELRLDLQPPAKPGEQPTFTLFCPFWRQLQRQRIEREMLAIHNGLNDQDITADPSVKTWTVILGTHQTFERRLG